MPVQHCASSEQDDGLSRQQSEDVLEPSYGTLHESPASQQSVSETQVSPGTGQQRKGPTAGLPPHTVSLHRPNTRLEQSESSRHCPYSCAQLQLPKLSSQLPEQQSASESHLAMSWPQQAPVGGVSILQPE
jgi:hypothetical protein